VDAQGVIIMRIDEGLYFANVGQIKEMLARIERLGSHLSHPTDRAKSGLAPLAGVIFDARNIFEMDPRCVQGSLTVSVSHGRLTLSCLAR